jgi:hypothetical protein
MSRLVGVDRAERALQERPVNCPRELGQRVVQVDDLVKPRPEQVLLPRLPSFGRIENPPPDPQAKKSRPAIRRNPARRFARKPAPNPQNPENSNTRHCPLSPLAQGVLNSSQTTGHMKNEGHLGRCYLKGSAGHAARVEGTSALDPRYSLSTVRDPITAQNPLVNGQQPNTARPPTLASSKAHWRALGSSLQCGSDTKMLGQVHQAAS